jgi:hypothetical protein
VALVVTALCGAWTIVLLSYGGFDAEIFGIKITTHEPLRPMAFTFVAFVVYATASGVTRMIARARAILAVTTDATDRMDDRLIAAALVMFVVAAGVAYGSKAAGGSDSYGYISEAELWLSGHLTISEPWIREVPWPGAEYTFAPLGYHHGPDRTTIVPVYSPGLPILMALAKRLAGQCAIFWVVPLSGGVLALATFGIGRRLGQSRDGVIAAWLVVTSPTFLFMLMAPMTDVPVAAAWAIVFWSLLGGTIGSSLLAGLSAALAVLIRPNLVPMVTLPALWLVMNVWRSPVGARSRRMWQLALFFVGLAPGIMAVAALNRLWYGSPVRSGYGTLDAIFAWSNVLPNLKNYAAWFVKTQTPLATLGLVALFIPTAWLWPRVTNRFTLVIFGLFVLAMWAEFSVYEVFDAWWYLRFLLPCWPFIMLGLATVLRLPARSGTMAGRLVTAAIVVALGLHGVRLAAQENVFDLQRGENKYPSVANVVRQRTDPNAVILSGLHSGSVRYYGGRMTMVYFNIDRPWLDRVVTWLAANGAHPYALLEEWEIKEFHERFSPLNVVGRLEMPPVFRYEDGAKIYFFDLLRPAGSAEPDEVIIEPAGPVTCQPPAPPPTLVFKH